MKKRWVGIEREWIYDHGFRIDDDGLILIPKSKWIRLQWTGTRLSNPSLKTLVIPSDFGTCLLTEGLHFRIIGG